MPKRCSDWGFVPRPRAGYRVSLTVLCGIAALLAAITLTGQAAARTTQTVGRVARPWTSAGYPDAYAAADPATGHLFVVVQNQNDNALVMVDMHSGAEIRRIPFKGVIYVAIASPATRRIIASVGGQGIVFIDSGSGAIVHVAHIAGFENSLAVAPQANRVIAFGGESPSLAVLDARTGAVLAEPVAGVTPTAIGLDEATGRVFVLSINDNLVSILNLRTGALLRPIGVPATPQALVVDAAGRRVYVLSPNERTLQALSDPDGNLVDELTLGPHTPAIGDALIIDQAANRLLIANTDGTATILTAYPLASLRTLTVGHGAVLADLDTTHDVAYLAGDSASTVQIVDMRDVTVHAVAHVPAALRQVVAGAGRAYVMSNGSSRYTTSFMPNGTGYLSILDGATGTRIAIVPVGAFPSLAAHAERLGRLFVLSDIATYPSLTTLDRAGRVVRTIRVSIHPFLAGHD